MSAGPAHWVVDASVGILLFVPETYSPQAQIFFDRLTADVPDYFYVPDLFYAECANIFWKYVQRHGYSASVAKKEISALKTLRLRSVSSADLMEKALELALRWDITAYDACYLALSEKLRAPLVTADERLARRVKGLNPRVEWIGNFPLIK
jgi:predicted nucleic acid-binding protein